MTHRQRFLATVCSVLALLAPAAARATETLRIATYNAEGLDPATASFSALVAVLGRMNADVVLLQEVDGNAEAAQLPVLAAQAGYPHFRVANASSSLAGGLRNAVLSRHPIVAHQSWTAAAISGVPGTNDISREILQVELAVPEVCAPVAVFTVHLKAGSTSTDDFRRAVELLRLKKVIETYLAAKPGARVFVGGDANDDVADGPFGATFTQAPAGLPGSFQLGPDVSFPLVYDPFATVTSIGGQILVPADATAEDCGNCYATRSASGRRLDYVWAPLFVPRLGDEVYDSGKDDGVDALPLGLYLRKHAAPLAAGTSAQASDHFPVFADYLLESCHGARFGTGSPDGHALVPRAGIRGTPVLGDGAFAARLLYARPSSAAILVLGSSKLAPPFGLPLAPYVPGANLHVSPLNAYGLFPLATDATGRALLPLPLPPVPAYAGLEFDLQWFVADAAAANGVGAMSDAVQVVLQ